MNNTTEKQRAKLVKHLITPIRKDLFIIDPDKKAKIEGAVLEHYLEVVGAIDRIESKGFNPETVGNLILKAEYLLNTAKTAHNLLTTGRVNND